MADIDVAIAGPEARSAIDSMLQLYTHDFSEQWAGEARGELGDDGRFDPYRPLDLYWREAGRIPRLIRVGGRLAGFALVNHVTHSGRPADRNMAEFFVVRKHRRSGAGTAAAHRIFSLHPGQWEAAVARRNTGALAFWRRAVATHPLVEAVEETDVATADWDGPILRFRIRAAS
jgi:predicted acetyltransferase